MYKTVTAARCSAGAQARIGLDSISIVTEFPLLNDTVAAGRRLAGVAVIAWVLVAIIAAFARSDDTIAATRYLAGVTAQVRIDTIPVIAFFSALILTITAPALWTAQL